MTKGERTAGRILDAAEQVFAAHGYEAASLREIAALAEIQQPGIYNHFASKEALYRAVLGRGLQPLADLMESMLEKPVGVNEMQKVAGRITDLLTEHPNISGLLVRAMQSTGHEGAEIALEWLERLMAIGRRLNEAAGSKRKPAELMLYQMALFNLSCGYFWGAPLIERLTGKNVLEEELLGLQKQLLAQIGEALAPGE